MRLHKTLHFPVRYMISSLENTYPRTPHPYRSMDLFGDSDREAEGFGADLVAPAPIMKPHVTRSDFGLLDKPILLHEDLSKGCGGMIWPAGELLTKYFLKRFMKGNELKGKRIVELGAGGGMTS